MKLYSGIIVVSVLAATSSTAFSDSKSKSNIFVSNKGDKSMSLVQCKTKRGKHAQPSSIQCEEKQNEVVGFATSWPANQYRGNKHWWWSGLSGEVIGLRARNSITPLLNDKNRMVVDTYTYDGVPAGLPQSGSNFIGVTPNGKSAWNAAREIDEIQEIDTDPHSKTFGQILTHIKVPLTTDASSGSATKGMMRPCDMSITPNGHYLWEPDIGGESVTGVDIKNKKVIAQITLPKVNPENRVIPFMLTTNNKFAIVENFEAPNGTVDILDVSDPANPKHLKKLTQADGLGVSPETGEFTPDGHYHYIINRGSPEVPGNVDVLDMKTLQIVEKIALPANCQPHNGDHTNDNKFFVVNCSGSDSIAVISNKHRVLVQEVALSGSVPRGLVVR